MQITKSLALKLVLVAAISALLIWGIIELVNSQKKCKPHCIKECGGQDGCGNNCPNCPSGQVCKNYQCSDCVANCAEKDCGESDGCGGICTQGSTSGGGYTTCAVDGSTLCKFVAKEEEPDNYNWQCVKCSSDCSDLPCESTNLKNTNECGGICGSVFPAQPRSPAVNLGCDLGTATGGCHCKPDEVCATAQATPPMQAHHCCTPNCEKKKSGALDGCGYPCP